MARIGITSDVIRPGTSVRTGMKITLRNRVGVRIATNKPANNCAWRRFDSGRESGVLISQRQTLFKLRKVRADQVGFSNEAGLAIIRLTNAPPSVKKKRSPSMKEKG